MMRDGVEKSAGSGKGDSYGGRVITEHHLPLLDALFIRSSRHIVAVRRRAAELAATLIYERR